jgi:WhiB family redox-sensing transcriptional regulator
MKYPQFTGSEPCTQVGADLFFTPDTSIVYRDIRKVKAVCEECPMREPCLDYALHVNVVGIWGGTTEKQRIIMRRKRRIVATPITQAS